MPINYTRKQVVVLTGMSEAPFKTLLRRGQLATLSATDSAWANAAENDDRSVPGWNRWNAHEVAAIAIQARFMDELGCIDGLRPDDAQKLADFGRGAVYEIAHGDRRRDLWAGYVSARVGGNFVDGTLPEVTIKLESARADDETPLRLILINVSEVVRQVEEIARAEGISFSLEPSE